ncbi:MAG: TrbI F-type domain-containing protein [Nevskiales bacterium]|nr:TrbI F-type domain-containing protein [Nevskiales bacterium]
MSTVQSLLFSLCAGMLGGLVVVLWARSTTPPVPSFATVDLQAVLARQLSTVDADAPNPDRNAARYAQALERSLDEIAQDNQRVLLSAPAVVRGAPDLTPALQAEIERRLAAGTDR